jgi:hypothetical protein
MSTGGAFFVSAGEMAVVLTCASVGFPRTPTGTNTMRAG